MLEPMAKVRIYGNKRRLHDFIEELRLAGVLHIVSVTRRSGEGLDEFEILTPIEADSLSQGRLARDREELRWVEQTAALLGVESAVRPAAGPAEPPDRELLKREMEAVRSLSVERDALTAEMEVASHYRQLVAAFGPVVRELGDLRRVRAVGVTLSAHYRDQVLPVLRERLEKITGGGYQMLWRALGEETLGVVILVPPSAAEAVGKLLADENIHEMRLPERYGDMPLLSGLAEVEKRLSEIPPRLEEIEHDLTSYRERYGSFLAAERERLGRELDEARAVGEMAASRFIFVAEGFLPRRELEPLRRRLALALGDDARLQEIPIRREDQTEIPVIFSNPPFLRPFERLLSFLPAPRYGTIDPTPLLAISFPFFFGLVLGDVGYGLILLLISLVLRWRARASTRMSTRASAVMRDLSSLLTVVSVASILFGFIYGEVFGAMNPYFGLKPLWKDRLEAAAGLLLFTVGVGCAHVFLSFFLGALQDLRNREPGRAVAKGISVGALVCIFVIVAWVGGLLPKTAGLGATVALAAAVVVLLYLEGIVAAIEIISAVGNILSYTRLMALGIAGAALAIVANRLAGAMGNLAAAVLVAVLLHGINLLLGVFGPTVHGLRLHFVEFLPRFYEYGGRAYRPFGGPPREKGVPP